MFHDFDEKNTYLIIDLSVNWIRNHRHDCGYYMVREKMINNGELISLFRNVKCFKICHDHTGFFGSHFLRLYLGKKFHKVAQNEIKTRWFFVFQKYGKLRAYELVLSF